MVGRSYGPRLILIAAPAVDRRRSMHGIRVDPVDNLPRVDPDTCITCFCCQEVCPEKAITLK